MYLSEGFLKGGLESTLDSALPYHKATSNNSEISWLLNFTNSTPVLIDSMFHFHKMELHWQNKNPYSTLTDCWTILSNDTLKNLFNRDEYVNTQGSCYGAKKRNQAAFVYSVRDFFNVRLAGRVIKDSITNLHKQKIYMHVSNLGIAFEKNNYFAWAYLKSSYRPYFRGGIHQDTIVTPPQFFGNYIYCSEALIDSRSGDIITTGLNKFMCIKGSRLLIYKIDELGVNKKVDEFTIKEFEELMTLNKNEIRSSTKE
jgi:hypothetical protein